MRCRSEWQAPAAPTWTSTSPGPGSGVGTSASTGSLFQDSSRSARIGSLPCAVVSRASDSRGCPPGGGRRVGHPRPGPSALTPHRSDGAAWWGPGRQDGSSTTKKRPILVAIGDSDKHDAALRFAADEAVRDRRPLRLVHVVHPPREGMFPEQMLISFTAVELAASQLLRSQADQRPSLTGGVVPVTQTLRRGSVVDHAGGARRDARTTWSSSTGSRRGCCGSSRAPRRPGWRRTRTVPVVSVPELWSGPSNHDVVVAPRPRRPGTSALLRHGFAEARARDARLTVLHAWYLPPLYDDALARPRPTCTIGGGRPRPDRGRPAAAAGGAPGGRRTRRAGAHAPGRCTRRAVRPQRPARAGTQLAVSPDVAHLGSVTRAVLREARCPVEVVDVVDPERGAARPDAPEAVSAP